MQNHSRAFLFRHIELHLQIRTQQIGQLNNPILARRGQQVLFIKFVLPNSFLQLECTGSLVFDSKLADWLFNMKPIDLESCVLIPVNKPKRACACGHKTICTYLVQVERDDRRVKEKRTLLALEDVELVRDYISVLRQLPANKV